MFFQLCAFAVCFGKIESLIKVLLKYFHSKLKSFQKSFLNNSPPLSFKAKYSNKKLAGLCEKYPQGAKTEEIPKAHWKHISEFGEGTNLHFNGDSLVSHVKGVEMVITSVVWVVVTGLKSSGLRINRGNLGFLEEFNKIQFYKGCLKNPHSKVRNFSVGGLKLDESLIAFKVSWILTPRGSNHSTFSEEDLLLIYCIMNKVKINWIHTIKEHMQKSMRLCDFHYPYAILISNFLHYFEVNIEGELAEVIKPFSEINSGSPK